MQTLSYDCLLYIIYIYIYIIYIYIHTYIYIYIASGLIPVSQFNWHFVEVGASNFEKTKHFELL